ncbi:hypothetical protein M9H77_01027 [Catharanthus roseus]|uniref:Uncharacterized protein n=1 Tax=Catharanthus roseus TaxID=4058 RepID=A0ACC0C4I6_CATRO|nr:hypothetical protein M9H77_01027 [Catharanthus roseus]
MPDFESSPSFKWSDLRSQNALFGKYEVGKLLGCGAFAKVYHARDVRNGQSVAIKVINKKKISSNTLMTNIKREISIMRQLRHPHIVRLYEVLATKTKIYFVMEYVKGGELFAKVSKGRLSESLSRKYFQQLISALSYCHSRGVFHRDLKPENLLLDENGDLKISDFGLSAVTDQVREDGLLYTLCGTPAYVAPEILAKKGYDGAKIDVWSSGVILYVLSAGYLPFNDPNLMVMYKKIYKGEFRCPKWMSSDLKKFLSRLLDTNSMSRITIDEIKRDPWFKKGYKELKFYEEDYNCSGSGDLQIKEEEEEKDKYACLNAFDIISFSTGLDLTGLFDESCNSVQDSQRLVVESSSPDAILDRIEQMAKDDDENLKLQKKKGRAVELHGPSGKFIMGLQVYRLTDSLVVVEVKRKAGAAGLFHDSWNNKIKPAILGRRFPESEISAC